MKVSLLFGTQIAGILWVVSIALSGRSVPAQTSAILEQPVNILIEAEEFQFEGGWGPQTDSFSLRGKHLGVVMNLPDGKSPTESVADAVTVIDIPQDGTWQVWARSRDFSQSTGTRLFQVMIDKQGLPKELGAHAGDGWAWEKAGAIELSAGRHALALHDTTHFYARCDALFLSNGDANPGKISSADMQDAREQPVWIVTSDSPWSGEANEEIKDIREVARLRNDRVQFIFEQGTSNGAPAFRYRTALNTEKGWQTVSVSALQSSLFLLHSTGNPLKPGLHPEWEQAGRMSRFELNGIAYEVQAEKHSPFGAGDVTLLPAVRIEKIGDGVRILHASSDQTATAIWTLSAGALHARCEVETVAARDGYYSLGFLGFESLASDQVAFVQLPPVFQYQRLSYRPEMVFSSIATHPMALVQKQAGPSWALTADPARLPFAWPELANAPYGFSLINPLGEAQPAVFSPVLGMTGSNWKAGEKRSVSWNLAACAGDWKEALTYVSDEILGVKDYRQPIDVSLTDAALNMLDLIRDEKAAGWDPEFKGFRQIELPDTVTQASPLAIIEAAVLSRDESFFRDRALPTLAFTLTRRSATLKRPASQAERDQNVTIPTGFYTTAYWQGVHALLAEKNPWLDEFILPGGDVSHTTWYSRTPLWSEWLAQYRYHPDPALLDRIRAEADAYIEKVVFGPHKRVLGTEMHYHVVAYPYWWDLVDLYELTGDDRYREAAVEGAFHTMAGLRAQPPAPARPVEIHTTPQIQSPLAMVQEKRTYRGNEVFRLGFPIKQNPSAHEVPAWQVSPVGLGIETLSTYVPASGGMRHTLMSMWSPDLLRLSGHTGLPILRTYARNGIIGRYANYPGYYLAFLTDLILNPRYPYEGPDLTTIYYHHIAPQLGLTVDYLFAQASVRSGGRVRFPYARQHSYAYFVHRVYGMAGGEVFGTSNVAPWLERGLVDLDKKSRPMVDWLAARSEDRFFVMLMNQAADFTTVSLKLDSKKIGLTGAGVTEVFINQQAVPGYHDLNKTPSVLLPPQGMVTLSMAAEKRPVSPQVPPLQNGHSVQKISDAWGNVHTFRIRGPFGSDALYVFVDGGPIADVAVELEVLQPSKSKQTRSRFPYEFLVYPVPTDQDIPFRLKTAKWENEPGRQMEITVGR
ncbi:hypothetical protein HQ520_06660 [bacterium]|nr:hypothetical protein [bacterium]